MGIASTKETLNSASSALTPPAGPPTSGPRQESGPSTATRTSSPEPEKEGEWTEASSLAADSDDTASSTGSQGSLAESWQDVAEQSTSSAVQDMISTSEPDISIPDVGHAPAPSNSSKTPLAASPEPLEPRQGKQGASSSAGEEVPDSPDTSSAPHPLPEIPVPGDGSLTESPSPAAIATDPGAGEASIANPGAEATCSTATTENSSSEAGNIRANSRYRPAPRPAYFPAKTAAGQRPPGSSDSRSEEGRDDARVARKKNVGCARKWIHRTQSEQGPDAQHWRRSSARDWPRRDEEPSWRQTQRVPSGTRAPLSASAAPRAAATKQITTPQHIQQPPDPAPKPTSPLNPAALEFVPKSIFAARHASKGKPSKVGEASDGVNKLRPRDRVTSTSQLAASASNGPRLRPAERKIPLSFGSSRLYESDLLPGPLPECREHEYDPAWQLHREQMAIQEHADSQASTAGPSTFTLPNRHHSPPSEAENNACASDEESYSFGSRSSDSASHGYNSDSSLFDCGVQHPQASFQGQTGHGPLAVPAMYRFDAPTAHSNFHDAGSSEYRGLQLIIAAQQANAEQQVHGPVGIADLHQSAQEDDGWTVVTQHGTGSSSSTAPYRTVWDQGAATVGANQAPQETFPVWEATSQDRSTSREDQASEANDNESQTSGRSARRNSL